MEDAFRVTISYWYRKQNNGENLGSPNSFLIKAIKNNWHPYRWNDNWIKNPIFKSEGMKWWDEAEIHWGRDKRKY